jgi:hypothetical protein
MYVGHWPPVQTRPFSAGAALTPADDLLTRPESGFTATLTTTNHPFNFNGNSATQYSDANNNNNNAVQGNNVQNELWGWSGAVGSAAPSCSDEPAPTADDDASSADPDHVAGFTNETGAGDTSGGSNEDPEMHRLSVCNWLNGLDPCIQMG